MTSMKENNPDPRTNLAQRIKAALHVYTKSLVSVKYYREIISTDLRFSLKYYVVLAVLFTLVNSLFSTIQVLPKLQKGIDDALEYALDLYEDDLVITINDGILSVNKDGPYIVPFVGVAGATVAKNLIVFDSEAGLDDLKDTYETLLLVNGTNILMQGPSKVEVFPIKDFPNAEITKDSFVSLVTQIRSFTKFVPYVVGVAFVLSMLFYYLVFRLIYLVVVAVLLWVVGSLRGLSLDFSKYYKVALHTMSLPLTVGLLNSVFMSSFYFPYWFFLLNAIFGILVVMSLENTSTEGDVLEGEVL